MDKQSTQVGVGAAGTVLQTIGQLGAGKAAKAAGQRQQVAYNFQAAQLDDQANNAVATAQRSARDETRRAELIASRALAVAAASGGGASDPTVVHIISDIKGEGAYRSSVAMYQGEERSRQLKIGASAKRYEGSIAAQAGLDKQSAYKTNAFGSLASGALSLYGKYGKGGPKGGSDPDGGYNDSAGTPDMSSYG
ncbi:MAG: hypothetical protein ACYC36_03500 [Bellilinea sp.]